MKTLVLLSSVDERRCRIFDEDLSRFNGAILQENDLGDEIYPIIYGDKGFIHDDWAINHDCVALFNAKEWDVMIFVDDIS